MKRKNKKFQKRNTNSLNKLSLFQKNDGKNFMTLISPDEWGKNDFQYIGAFKQDSRQKWNHIELEEVSTNISISSYLTGEFSLKNLKLITKKNNIENLLRFYRLITLQN